MMDFLKAQFTKIPHITPTNLSSSTILITGANAGIGFEAAKEVLKSQPKRLILAVRNLERGNNAASELSKFKSESTEIDVRHLDQSKFSSVQAFANELKGQKVDIAILNAGEPTNLTTVGSRICYLRLPHRHLELQVVSNRRWLRDRPTSKRARPCTALASSAPQPTKRSIPTYLCFGCY